MMIEVVIYTDGAYSSSLNQGGVGIIFIKNNKKVLEYSRMYKNTTNNQMELAAIIIALKSIKGKIDKLTIYSDSMYCIGCATLGWKRQKNVLLWKCFDEEYKRVSELCSDISLVHVKGHQQNNNEFAKWNNYVDHLAVMASKSI